MAAIEDAPRVNKLRMPSPGDAVYAAACVGSVAIVVWGQLSIGSYVHAYVYLGSPHRRVGELVPFLFTTWSTVADFGHANAVLFSGLLALTSGVQPFAMLGLLLGLHLARGNPRVARSPRLRRWRRIALEGCAHLIKFTRSMDLSAYVFTVALRQDAFALDASVVVEVRAMPSIGILANELANMATVGLCFYALFSKDGAAAAPEKRLEAPLLRPSSRDPSTDLSVVSENEPCDYDEDRPSVPFWFTPAAPRRPPPRVRDRDEAAPSWVVVALGAATLGLLAAALRLPVITIRSRGALPVFIPKRVREFSILGLCAAPVKTHAAQRPAVALSVHREHRCESRNEC